MTDECAPIAGTVLTVGQHGPAFLVLATGSASRPVCFDGTELVRGRPIRCGAENPGPRQVIGAGTRFIDPVSGLRLLCLRSGNGTLLLDGRQLIPEHELVAP